MPSGLDEGGFGPLVRGGRVRRGGPDWRRLSLFVLVPCCVFMVAVGTSAAVAVWYGSSQIERIAVPEVVPPGDIDQDGEVDVEELTDVLNVLVVGSDSREGLTEDQLLALGTEEEDGLRTDTIMLLQLDPRRDTVSVLSFPRDLLVTRCDGTRGRINAAYAIGEESGIGGPSCLVRTVTDFTGISVNHVIQVNFAGFVDIVDALGGVTLYLEEPIRDAYAGADFPAGCVTMDGISALSFVRVRRIDSDFGRIARQQRFIREVVREAASVGTLVNPPRLFSLVDAGARAVVTDDQLSLRQMQRIAFSLRDLGPDSLDTRTVPATPRTINGAAFVVADEEAAEELFIAFRESTLARDDLGREEPQAVAIDDVPPVLVLNGAGISGLALEAAEELEAAGFTVDGTDNAESFDFTATQVIHAPEQLEEAQLLAQALGDVVLLPGEEGQQLTVVLGSDFEASEVSTPDPGATDAATEGSDDEPTATEAPATPTPSPTPTFVGAEPGGEC
jgi:LCP family protein required for cell wall assembly